MQDTTAMKRQLLLGISAVLVTTGVGFAAWRVLELEGRERALASEWQVLAEASGGHHELIRTNLSSGALATFEVCFVDRLEPAVWAGTLELAVLHPASEHVMVSIPLEESVLAYATRGERAACLLLAFDEEIEADGEYIVEASWSDRGLPDRLRRVPISARVLSHMPLSALDALLVVLVLVGALLILLAAVLRQRSWSDRADELDGVTRTSEASSTHTQASRSPLSSPLLRAGLGVAALLGVAVGLGFVPLHGASWSLGHDLILVVAQVCIALALVRGAPRETLALGRPTRTGWSLWLAPVVGLGLWFAGVVLSGIVPATGVAPIQTLVSSSSGMLSVATAAAVVPLAEELFYRGFLFGTIAARAGKPVAFGVTVTLFTLAHLSQAWGAWGAICAILVTGLVLTGLRWWTGSVIVPALVHLAHNGIIVYLSVTASSAG